MSKIWMRLAIQRRRCARRRVVKIYLLCLPTQKRSVQTW